MKKIFWVLRGITYKFFLKRVGRLSYIGKPLLILGSKHITLEDKVRIFPGARIEAHGNGAIIIQENCSIGQNIHLVASDELIIGKNTTISSNVLITDTDHDYSEINKHILEQKLIVKQTKIGDNCFIGAGVKINAGTQLGKQCIVGSNAVVKGTFPDYCVIAGVPAKIIKKYNEETKEWEKVI